MNEVKKITSEDEWHPKHLDIVGIAFIVTLLVSNIAAVKLFSLGSAIFSAGILIFPISYVIGDVLTEVYGYKRTRRLIWLGLLSNVFMVSFLTIAVILPPAHNWSYQDQFAIIHGFIPRIVLGSLVGYWLGEIVNSTIMSKMKVWSDGRHLWLRTVISTLFGEGVDTICFISIAYIGILPKNILISAMISAWIFKCLYEIIVTPFTYMAVNFLKRKEGVDQYDSKVNYNPFKISIK
ncbi:queuosine precursor transporter [Candidatus Uabimicrobium amorphum]|uniref:Probable queuosine precursor transporter n=1 Tax=Uabimicrobium amorphum TaxID=2596890 RepID=A0A5S9F5R6_UABAM|nr:queuosine precursor transporter [Candidatus Uabimicrobium amorphum]BBM87127.1 transporter [Candidatus Uabimicrobium amorphum]